MNRFITTLLLQCIIAALALMTSGCSSDKEEVVPDPTPALKTETQSIDYQATVVNCQFTATGTWRATSDADWCTLSRSQGAAGDIKLDINVSENYSGEDRSAKVSIVSITDNKEFVALTINQAAKTVIKPDDTNNEAPAGMKSNATLLVQQIQVGWNIGNTCESGIWDGWSGDDLSIETNWGNPKVTRTLIDAVKAAGFNAVRIPTRWFVHADDNLNINEAWLNRIKEIVDYAYANDMYVILNSHHDNWYDRLAPGYNEAQIQERFANMWRCIANYFKDYDEHLIFAGVNEVVYLDANGNENWGTPTDAHVKMLCALMQTFVNTVRETGGNNAWRCLMIQPWAANIEFAYHKGFSMPTDKVADRLILEFHNYTWSYSTEAAGSDNKYFWGQDYSSYKPWYADGEKQITAMYDKIKSTFIDNGVPVIMAEFGCVQHNNSTDESACDRSRAYYHKYVVTEARKRGIPGFYWDNGAFSGSGENFGLFDRKTGQVPARAQIALDGIMGR